MLDICKRLGLISQLNELKTLEGMDLEIIDELMYGQCVEVIHRLNYSESYDLARDVYTYSNFDLEGYSSIVQAAEALGENFDKGIDSLIQEGNYQKVK